jgi:XTP/dITP diphosphohydrolase
VVVLVTSPRVAPGLLTHDAWERLREAEQVLAADPDPAWQSCLGRAGIALTDVADRPVGLRAASLLEGAQGGRCVAWLGSPDGDPGLTEALAQELSRRSIDGRPPEIEVVTGSYDIPGSRALDLVAVMDQLRSPGGCPWDAEQTHESLLPFLLEETHEVIDAVQSGDRANLREELGDLMLQVVFHARVAQEHPEDPFDLDEVCAGIVTKLIRRHPHVFGGEQGSAGGDAVALPNDAEAVHDVWEAIKTQEKRREGPFDGIPATLPSLARAQKMLDRLQKALGEAALEDVTARAVRSGPLAEALLDAVLLARSEDLDAEATLRALLHDLARSQRA